MPPKTIHLILLCVPWLVSMCTMTRLHVWHDSWLNIECRRMKSIWYCNMCAHDSFIFVTWLITEYQTPSMTIQILSIYTICATIHLYYMCHDSFILYVPWRDSLLNTKRRRWLSTTIHLCYMCHDSLICATWLLNMCAMTHSRVWHTEHRKPSITCILSTRLQMNHVTAKIRATKHAAEMSIIYKYYLLFIELGDFSISYSLTW